MKRPGREEEVARTLRATILQWIGIPVSAQFLSRRYTTRWEELLWVR